MKTRISVTIDEEKIALIEGVLKKGIFRNKSHILEFALAKFLDGEDETKIGGLSNERA